MSKNAFLFRQLFDRESYTYSYLLADQNGKAILIDGVAGQEQQYLQLIKELKLDLQLMVDTHTHADHITSLGAMRELTGAKTQVGEQSLASCADGQYRHGDTLNVGDLVLEVRYTPGHTDDSYSFYSSQLNAVFTGDTLLIRGTGRTDFQSGDALQQYQSIHGQLLSLPETTRVYPGHDYRGWSESTIGEERAHNPRLQVVGPDEYKELMDHLNLPDPKMMDIAVPANQSCGQLQ